MRSFDNRARNWDEDPIRVERARAVAGAIARMVPLHDRISCIEYGAGTGLLGFALQPQVGTMLLTDASAAMTEVAGEKIASAELEDKMRVLQLDLLTDPTPAERFDLLITQMTLHHIPDIPAILSAFFGLLASPGWLCIADLDMEDGSFHDSGFQGHRGFDRAALGRQVEEAGFCTPGFETAYTMRRLRDGEERFYPLFLLAAKKE